MVLRSMKRHKSNEEIETSIILQSLSFIYIVTSTAEQDSTTCRLWDFDCNTICIALFFDTMFVMTGKYPLGYTWGAGPLGGLVQAS